MTRRLRTFTRAGFFVVLLGLLASGSSDRADTGSLQRRGATTSPGSGAGAPGSGAGASGSGATQSGGGRAPRSETAGPLFRAALSIEDLEQTSPTEETDADWSEFDLSEVPPDDFVRIGGEVGVGNVPGTVRRKVEIAYEQESSDGEPSGYVSNSILLMGDEDEARNVMSALRASAQTTSWTQSFSDGDDSYQLAPLPFEDVGDETFAVRLSITTKDRRSGIETTDQVDYVVFRIDPAVSFVFVSRAEAGALVRKSAEKVGELLEDEFR